MSEGHKMLVSYKTPTQWNYLIPLPLISLQLIIIGTLASLDTELSVSPAEIKECSQLHALI